MPDPLWRLGSPLSLLALSMSKLGRGAGVVVERDREWEHSTPVVI